MSFLQTLTVDSFIRYNPQWKIFLWIPLRSYTGHLKYIPDYTGQDYFDVIKSNKNIEIRDVDLKLYNIKEDLHDILRSDIFRYKILYEYGGVWSDFDVLWLKEIQLPDNITDTVCMLKQFTGHHNISVMFHQPQTEFIKSLIICTDIVNRENRKKFDHQAFGTSMLNRLYPTFDMIKERFPNILPLKYEVIFPYPIFSLKNLYHKDVDFTDKDTLCLHWFNGSELSKDYVNNKNFRDIKCSMTSILKREKWVSE